MTKVLMVCLANICRSPMAEGILESKLTNKSIKVDSAGTGGYFEDTPPDERAIAVAKNHNIDISEKRSRIFSVKDFDDFDIIYAMDKKNVQMISELARSEEDRAKIVLILDELFPNQNLDVPDPYTASMSAFRNAYEMLDEVCEVIAKKLNSKV